MKKTNKPKPAARTRRPAPAKAKRKTGRAVPPMTAAIKTLGRRACLSTVAAMLAPLAGDERDAELRAELLQFCGTVTLTAAGMTDDTPTDTTPDDTEAGLQAVDEAFHTMGARQCVRAVVKTMESGPAASALLAAVERFDDAFDACMDREDGMEFEDEGQDEDGGAEEEEGDDGEDD